MLLKLKSPLKSFYPIKIALCACAFFLLGAAPLPKFCNSTPKLNQQILQFVKPQIGKKVATGECWDLAAEALDKVHAKWDHDFGFGNILNVQEGECISPGDIVQFEGVKLKYQKGNTIVMEDYAHHTAIIYSISSKGDIMLAQQNTTAHGKKVSVDVFMPDAVQTGTVTYYRPIN